MSFPKKLSFLSLFCLLLVIPLRLIVADEADHVVVVVNASDPDSMQIAKYYTERRGIPQDNIIELPMSTKETVSVREFVDTIYNPLLNALIDEGWVKAVKATGLDVTGRERVVVATHRISYLVTTRGVPLRIANDPTLLEGGMGDIPKQFQVNNGSVDGELALLASSSNVPMGALVPNPLFSKLNATSLDAKRVIRVSRLDGPSAGAVLRLIDRSLEAEASGLMGRAYFDTGGPHKKGDEWIQAAGELAVKAYFDTDFETTKRVMDGRDRYDAPAIYMGWYTQNAYGPWRAEKWSVPPGAIGFHLHSFSATTVRSTTKGWLGAFVNQGYCATVGNVYEPYLDYTHHPQLLLEALLAGRTFGEAAMYSNPSLSWQGVAIGDPLYRPFKVDLDAQLKEQSASPFASYVSIREINRLEAQGNGAEAIAFGRTRFVQQPSLALGYKLAQLYAADGKNKQAVEVLSIVRYISTFSADEVVLAQQVADFLNQHNASALALEVYQKLLMEKGLEKSLRISLLEAGSKVALSCSDAQQASSWSVEVRKLK